MSLRKLPEIKAFKALSNMEWQPRTDVVDRWNAGIHAATSDEASISILGEIGGGDYGDGITSKRIAGALRSIGERDVRVDINSPSIEELQKLLGIGSVRAAAIVAERAHSRFDTVDELVRVDGVGKRLLVELRDHVTVAPGVSGK